MARPTNPQGIRTNGYRSKFEAKIAQQLESEGVSFEYENMSLSYVLTKKYTPDFQLLIGTGRIIEVKGWFRGPDRTKLLAVKRDNPKLDLRLVFQRASSKIYKGSNTTYAKWATDHGIPWAEGFIPKSWLKP